MANPNGEITSEKMATEEIRRHPELSKRGEESLIVPEGDLLSLIVMKVWGNLYNKETNPNGVINVGVAENYLPQKELAQWLQENVKIDPFDLTYGDSLSGGRRLRKNLANLYNTRLSPLTPLDPDNILISSGVSSVVDQLGWVLADPGDGILIGKPFYGGFKKDLIARSKVETVLVSLKEFDDPLGVEAVAKFEKELIASEKRGVKIRAIILCNPHNPLGRCYTREALDAYMLLCKKYSLHLISDEIYAFTIYPPQDPSAHAPPFQSILSIPPLMDPEYIHVAYGASKDFVMNGLRLGFVYTINPRVKAAYGDIAFFSRPSSVSEVYWNTMLENPDYLDSYLAKNIELLSRGRDIVTGWLDSHSIPYVRNTYAGFFIWVDFRRYLPTKDSKTGKPLEGIDRERKLTLRMVDRGVYLATGETFGGEEPGYYRLSFANEPEELEKGLKRLGEALWGEEKQNGAVEEVRSQLERVLASEKSVQG